MNLYYTVTLANQANYPWLLYDIDSWPSPFMKSRVLGFVTYVDFYIQQWAPKLVTVVCNFVPPRMCIR